MLHDGSRVVTGQPGVTGVYFGGRCAQLPQSVPDGPAVAGAALVGVADPDQAPRAVGPCLCLDLVGRGLAAGGAQPAPAAADDRAVDPGPGGVGDALWRAVP